MTHTHDEAMSQGQLLLLEGQQLLAQGDRAGAAQVLARAREMIANGQDPAAALEYLAHTLTGKLLHAPSVRLREAAEAGDNALLDAAARLFGNDGNPPR